MKPKFLKLFVLIMLASLALVACQGSAGNAPGETATPLPPVKSEGVTVVDGSLVPAKDVELAFDSSGEVSEVLVKEGDLVQAGQAIASLGNQAQLASSLANAKSEQTAAEQELLDSQQALQKLSDDLADAQTASLQALTDARQEVRDAQRKVDGLQTQATTADINEAYANMVLAKDRLERAQKDYKPYENKDDDNVIRAAFLNKLATAQRNYDAAVRRYNNYTGPAGEFDLNQAAAELKVAQARLESAQSEFDKLQNGPDPDEVALAQARINSAQSRLESAKAAVQAAEVALQKNDLLATINGTVVHLDLIPGQRVTPGTPVVQLADFSQWYVETDNLTEIEVVNVKLNDQAEIVADALPDVKLSGTVDKIADQFEEKRGDVTYTARLKVNGADPRLRWGMTVVVNFAAQE